MPPAPGMPGGFPRPPGAAPLPGVGVPPRRDPFGLPPQQAQQPVQQRPTYDPKAEAWAEENEWYGKNVAMTHAAQGIHKQMVLAERFDPNSDEYYDELNNRLREAFPTQFNTKNRTNRPVQTVAPASRSSGVNNARRTVRLSPSQVAIAKKLGVPLEEYAKYVKE